MRLARPVAPFLVAAAVVLAAACGPKRVAEPVAPGQTLVVLLPDPDTGEVGQATLWNKAGSADLTHERDSASASSTRTPGPVVKMDDEDIRRLFGAALDALPPEPRSFTLFFKFESDELTEESAQLVPSVLEIVKQRSDPEVSVVGHTDTMGQAKANVELGFKRAAFVRNLLVQAGLDPSTIEVVSHGEAALLVRTPDETPEPRNRRVEITVR